MSDPSFDPTRLLRDRTPRDRLPALLRGMPKAELHIHIEGSLEPELIFRLAARNRLVLPYDSVDALRAAYAFSNLQSFLDIYYAGASVLLTEADFYDMAMAYFERAHADHIVHAEVMFDPQTHTERGVAFATVINGLARAQRDARLRFGLSSSLIMSFLRHLSEAQAFETLEQALPFRHLIETIGLDSSELGHPPEKFERVYARCRQLGFRLTAHAGEEGPAAYVHAAIDCLRVERIDHGVQCLTDPVLVSKLVSRRIALTTCPLSNVKLRVFNRLADHNLGRLLDAGLLATVNSDDPAYFGGYLNQNFVESFEALGLGATHAWQLARNGFEASFVAERERASRLDEVEEYFAAL